MKQKRRGFIVTVAAAIGVSGVALSEKLTGKKRPYQATLTCKLNREFAPGDFFEDQKIWENPDRVLALCDKYQKDGRLLRSDFVDLGDKRMWTYVFASRVDFEAWFKEVFGTGSFDPMKVPQKYTYSVDGAYV